MKIFMLSLGCAKNQVDSEIMLGRLTEAGGNVVQNPDEADVIIVNTCSFIEDAAAESIDSILELAKFKKKGNCRKLIVAGCLPERYREDIAEALPEADMFLGTGAFDRIVQAAEMQNFMSLPTCNLQPKCFLPRPDAAPISGGPRVLTIPYSAYLKISEGCSRHCTYCIIPRLRGKQRSRVPEDIVSEARELTASGVKELILVAQDTTGYGADLQGNITLSGLLAMLAQLSENLWIRFLYGHPESISESLIRTAASHPNICPYFDIPIQHASSRILKGMGRHYSREDLYALFDRIRSALPEAVLRTTVIAGFPGETEKDFKLLLQFVKDIRFDHLGVFTYSDAEDLASHRLSGHVPKKTAQRRCQRIMSCQSEISLQKNQKYVGKALTVLAEEKTEPGLFAGRTAFQSPDVDGITYIHADDLEIGSFVRVRITDALEYDLIGEIED
jgi:ribosomal protein S12 methylthiotransferase